MRTRQPRRMNSALRSLGDSYEDAINNATAEYNADETGGYRYYEATPSGYGASNTELDAAIRAGQAGSGMTPGELTRTVTTAEILNSAEQVATLPGISFDAADANRVVRLGAQVYQMRAMRNPSGQTYYAPVPVGGAQMSPLAIAAIAALAYFALA